MSFDDLSDLKMPDLDLLNLSMSELDRAEQDGPEAPSSPQNLQILEGLFQKAARASQRGKTDDAIKLFKEILKVEPRMAEPRLEIALLLLQTGELEEAEAQAREGLAQLEAGWQWLDDFTEEQLLAHACNLLGEILKARSVSDELVAEGPAAMQALWNEAGELFGRAVGYDAQNVDANRNHLGFKARKRPPVPG